MAWIGLRSSLVGGGVARLADRAKEGPPMSVKFRTTGCLFSIIASIVLTVALNLLLRTCSG